MSPTQRIPWILAMLVMAGMVLVPISVAAAGEFDPKSVTEEVRNSSLSTAAAQAVIHDFGIHPDDISAVYWVQPVYEGVSLEEIEIVVAGEEKYYFFPEDGHIEESEPPSITWTNQRYERGVSVVNVAGGAKYCHQNELVVTFPPLPTCFYQISPGRYDGIEDAWAESSNCNGCRPSCTFGLCGTAWDGPGYNSWYSFTGCPGRNSNWTTNAGKLVQKRWYYAWNQCYGLDNATIARKVERLIRW